VLFCHDIIPLMFPHFYKGADVEAQRRYCDLAFPAADLVIFSSRTVAADVRAYCDARGIAHGAFAVCPLGANASASAARAPLPVGLEAGRYALLVSTIEPRKGHRLIYDAWVKLLEAGIPQRARFKLVFAGRKGWMVDDLMRDLRRDPRIAGTLQVLPDADDATVSALYRDAAFCLYPSRYEGYGLPLVEAFRHGKAVLASTGGAVPEVVGGFSPCLDPTDGEAWHGPALMEILEGIDAKTAASRPVSAAHSIWELVLHVSAWEQVVTRRMQGEALTLTDEQNFGHVGQANEENWRQTIQTLQKNHSDLIKAVSSLPESRLKERLDHFDRVEIHGEQHV